MEHKVIHENSSGGVTKNTGDPDGQPILNGDVKSSKWPLPDVKNVLSDPQRYRAKPLCPWDWVEVYTMGLESNWPHEIETESPNGRQNDDSTNMDIVGKGDKQAESLIEKSHLIINAQNERIEILQKRLLQEQNRSRRLRAKYQGMIVVLTRYLQSEFDMLQNKFLDLQTAAEHWLFGDEWQRLFHNLDSIDRKLLEYIQNRNSPAVSDSNRDELTMFLTKISGKLSNLWEGLDKLERNIKDNEKKWNDENENEDEGGPEDQKPEFETALERYNNISDDNDASGFSNHSVAQMLKYHAEGSQSQRERMATRKDKGAIIFEWNFDSDQSPPRRYGV
ncbi:hypothetical protein GGS21DRAFT_493174 [Xylaria nigripes]|nr:hypothetical protein GGS21DRAFT_493174 [Xylaria nigripes]